MLPTTQTAKDRTSPLPPSSGEGGKNEKDMKNEKEASKQEQKRSAIPPQYQNHQSRKHPERTHAGWMAALTTSMQNAMLCAAHSIQNGNRDQL